MYLKPKGIRNLISDTENKGGGTMWNSKKEASSAEPDYEFEILDIFVKEITKYGDDPGDELLLAVIKQAIESFNELHELGIYPLSKEVGDGIIKFLMEMSEFIGLSKGNEKLIESWRKF